MSAWPRRRLGDLAHVSLGKMLDAKKNAGELRPYLANVNVRWGEFDLDGLRQMRFQDDEVDRFGLRFGDIVMCEGGEPGRCAIWKEAVPGMVFQKALHRIRAREDVDHRFLYYSLLLKGRLGAFGQHLTGATIKHLPLERLLELEVEIPPRVVQERTAEVLSGYDDLIENNRRRTALLEEAARQLYREWFVRLRFPGHEHTRIVDDVPVGWTSTVLGQVAENLDRQRVPLSVFEREARPGPYPYHGAAGVLDHIDGYLFDGRFLLVGEDGTVQTTGGTPMLQLVEGKFWVSNHAHVLKGAAVSTEFLYCCLSAYPIAGHVTGVAQPKLTQANLNRIPVAVPTGVYREQFQEVVEPMFDQLFVLRAQNEQLRAARDLLLPRLMSGEIAV